MKKIILPVIGVLALTAFFSVFIVKEVNQAIVLQFGDPKRILLKPGLNFKLPFIQNVVFLDKRILNLFSSVFFLYHQIEELFLG